MATKTTAEARKKRHARVRKHVSGTAECPRLNVYRAVAEIYAQVINDLDGHTLVAASTVDKDLRVKLTGKTKTEQARLVGLALAERAKALGITTVVFDRGGFRYMGRVKALADGAREGGLTF